MSQEKEGCCIHENATTTNYDSSECSSTPVRASVRASAAVSANSYQKSSSNSSLRNMDATASTTTTSTDRRSSGILHRFIDSTFRGFSIEQGYENPPQAEQEEESQDDGEANNRDVDDENDIGNDKNDSISSTPSSSPRHNRCVLVVSVMLVVSFVASLAVYIYFTHGRGQGPLLQYTGEENDDFAAASESNNKEKQTQKLIQTLKSFSTLPPMDHGVVAADHPTCSEIGLSMMRDLGGNAIDAAVATALCLGVANPSSSGIGGGAFILIHADADNYLKNLDQKPQPKYHEARINPKTFAKGTTDKINEVIDCREVAGEKASTTMFEDEGVPSDASLFGGLAIGVPGELKGLELSHARHGRLEWAAVVRPAMELARNGVPVYTHLAHDIEMMQGRQALHGNGLPTLRKLLTHDNDWKHILKEGQLIKNVKLADTLQAIMEDGSDALYVGTRAEQLANDIQRGGGILTKDDIELYLPTLRDPVISDNVFGIRVVGVPPPSSGGAVIIGAIRFLAGFATPLASFADTLGIHRMTEAMKHAFAIRMSMGDPAFPIGNDVTNATTYDAVEALIQGSYMEELRQSSYSDNRVLNMSHYGGPKFAQLNDSDGSAHGHDAKEGDRRRRRRRLQRQKGRRRLADPFGYLEDHGTSHLSVVDADGNAVAITTSVNAQFGCGIVSESTGIVLNNQMDGK